METEALSREAILGAEDLPTEKVQIPEWKGYLNVKTMTGTERDKLESDMLEQRGRKSSMNLKNYRARLCSLVAVDDKDKRVFTDDDAIELGKKNAKALDRIFSVAQRLNGLTPEDVEESTRGLDENPSEGSVLDSP